MMMSIIYTECSGDLLGNQVVPEDCWSVSGEVDLGCEAEG